MAPRSCRQGESLRTDPQARGAAPEAVMMISCGACGYSGPYRLFIESFGKPLVHNQFQCPECQCAWQIQRIQNRNEIRILRPSRTPSSPSIPVVPIVALGQLGLYEVPPYQSGSLPTCTI